MTTYKEFEQKPVLFHSRRNKKGKEKREREQEEKQGRRDFCGQYSSLNVETNNNSFYFYFGVFIFIL